MRSTIASPTFTPALKVRSTTAPVFTLRSFVRTKAPPLPGFTCWNSIDLEQRAVELEGHAVLEVVRGNAHAALSSLTARSGRGWTVAEHPAPVVGHLDHVLDADAAEPGHVDAGLDRDDRAGRQRVLVELATEPRTLVDLEPDAVAEAVR